MILFLAGRMAAEDGPKMQKVKKAHGVHCDKKARKMK